MLVRELIERRAHGPAQSLAARDRRRRRRLGDRARTGRRRAPPRGRLLDDARAEELIAFLRGGRRAAAPRRRQRRRRSPERARPSLRSRTMDGVLLIDKPAGMTSHDVVARVRRALGGARTGHAGTLDPFATGLLLVLVGRATKAQQHLMALPKRYETVAQLGATSSTGDTEGEINETGRCRPIRRAADGRGAPAPAGPLGGEDRRRARLQARAPRRELEMPERIVTVHRFEQIWREPRAERPGCSARLRDRMRLGHVRALADRRPRRRLLPGAAAHGDRAVRGRGRRRAADARERGDARRRERTRR